MGCYPCTRCNKCGTFSARAMIVCADYGEEIAPGQFGCKVCGSRKIKSIKLPDAKPTPRVAPSVQPPVTAVPARNDRSVP